MKNTPSSMPIDSVPSTPESRISARGSPPIVTGSASAAKCRVNPSTSVLSSQSDAALIAVPPRRARARAFSSPCSYRLHTDHPDRLELAARQHGERLPHVAIAVARADHGIAAGTELQLSRQERAEASDAVYRDLGLTVGDELHRDRGFRDGDQLVEPRDLLRQPRLLADRGQRLARLGEQRLGAGKHV